MLDDGHTQRATFERIVAFRDLRTALQATRNDCLILIFLLLSLLFLVLLLIFLSLVLLACHAVIGHPFFVTQTFRDDISAAPDRF